MWSAQTTLALTRTQEGRRPSERQRLRKCAGQSGLKLGLGYEHTRLPTAATWIRISIQAYSRARYGHALSINGF